MKPNSVCISFIKEFEGCKLQAYQDCVGKWTIGFGSTECVSAGMCISQEEADKRLLDHLTTLASQVSKLLKRPVSENQFGALLAFAYNVGIGNLEKSTLLRCLNMGHPEDAANEFLKWNKAGGIADAGLIRRRKAERELFLRS